MANNEWLVVGRGGTLAAVRTSEIITIMPNEPHEDYASVVTLRTGQRLLFAQTPQEIWNRVRKLLEAQEASDAE